MINDDRLLITDGVHTENTALHGCPQADDGGEREVIHTLSIKIGVHQAEASAGN